MTKQSIQNQIEQLQQQLVELKAQMNQIQTPKMIKIPDRNYSVSETPITVGQYRAFCNESTGHTLPSQPEPLSDNNPITNVTWHEACAYAAWLSDKTGDTYSLPTEDQFEHFAGDHQEGTPETAVYAQNAITEVRTKAPNKYGLYDVLGLVWEMQHDTYE